MIHLRPTAPLAERVLLPGDPGRALRLAQGLLEAPKMLNHHRGLWGYTGLAGDGTPLSIQSTGMGGPSCAIVVHELIELGARRLVRVGTCGALAPAPGLGELVVATGALAADGTSRALGCRDGRAPVPALAEALRAAAPGAAAGLIVTTDLFYDPEAPHDDWRAAGALAVEMESSVLFTLAARHEAAAGTALVVSDQAFGEHARIGEDRLHAAELELGAIALRALPPA